MTDSLSLLLARAVRHKQPLPFFVFSNAPIAMAAIKACEVAQRPFVAILDSDALFMQSALTEAVQSSKVDAICILAQDFDKVMNAIPTLFMPGAPAAADVKQASAGMPVVIGTGYQTDGTLQAAVRAGAAGVLFAEELSKAYTAGLRAALRDRELADPVVYERKASLAVTERVHNFLSATNKR